MSDIEARIAALESAVIALNTGMFPNYNNSGQSLIGATQLGVNEAWKHIGNLETNGCLVPSYDSQVTQDTKISGLVAAIDILKRKFGYEDSGSGSSPCFTPSPGPLCECLNNSAQISKIISDLELMNERVLQLGEIMNDNDSDD